MTSYTVTTKVNNPNYDCSADFTNTAFDKAVEYIIRVNNTKYEAISGATGRLVYGGADDEGSVDGDDDSAVIAAVLAAVTSGVVLLNGVAFDLTQFGDIPENVRVVCNYGAEHWEYINSADSSGSPYTVSVGSGVNAGYYMAQDSAGRYINEWSSTDAATTIQYTLNAVKGITYETIKALGFFPLASALLVLPYTIFDCTEASMKVMDNTPINIVYLTDNTQLIGGYFDGNKANNVPSGNVTLQTGIGIHGSNILVKEATVTGTIYHGIVGGFGESGVKIINCNITDIGTVAGSYGHGMYLRLLKDSLITGCTINNTVWSCIELPRSQSIIVSNNHLSNAGYGGSIAAGVDVAGDTPGYYAYNLSILQNTISNCYDGVRLFYCVDSLVNENTIIASKNNAVRLVSNCSGTDIKSNSLLGANVGAAAVTVEGSSNLTISTNDISDFLGNFVIITAEDTSNIKLYANTITNWKSSNGIAMHIYGANHTLQSNILTQNILGTSVGIQLRTSGSDWVFANQVNNANYGIREISGTDYNLIQNNQLNGCTAPITITGSNSIKTGNYNNVEAIT